MILAAGSLKLESEPLIINVMTYRAQNEGKREEKGGEVKEEIAQPVIPVLYLIFRYIKS